MSIIRDNARKDPTYCPYCLRCTGLVRMVKVAPLFWRCKCGAIHDERLLSCLYEITLPHLVTT